MTLPWNTWLVSEQCCTNEPRVVIKPHVRTDTLLGGRYITACAEHYGEYVRTEVDRMLQDDDTMGVSVTRP